MADFSALKTSIQNYIKQNGNEEITGNLLQQILLSMVSTLGDSAINDLVTVLNAEIANRGNADTELGGRITTLKGVVNGIKANVENGYVYAGIATPSTTPVSGKVFYLALTAGTYTNFGSIVVPQGINILKYNGSAWSLDSFLGLDDAPTQGSNNLVKSGGAKLYTDKRTIKEDGNIILYPLNKCYDENGNLKLYASWMASALIDIDEVLNDSIILSQAANGNENNNISSVVFYNSSKVKIGNLFTSNVSSVTKTSMPYGTKYVAFSFYNKDTITIQDYSYDSRISKLNGLINTNKAAIETIDNKIGEERKVESTIETGQGTQYILHSYSIDEKIFYIKIGGTAQFSAALYYNFEFNDGTWTGEKRLSLSNDYIKFDADTKRYKTLNVYATAAIIAQGGDSIVTLLTESIVKELVFFQEELDTVNENVDILKDEVFTIGHNPDDKWKSDNLWDANHLFNGYLMTNSDTGVPIANNEWRITDYLIPVIAGAKVYLRKIGTTTNSTFTVAEYDSNKDFIKRDSQKQQAEYTVPSDVAYIKISVYKGHVNNGQDYPNFPLYSIQSYREFYLCSDYNPPYGVYLNLRQGTKLQGKKIAYFGDSIIGFGNVCKYLKNYTGAAEVYNVGFGGCRMAAHDANYGAFSMYNLAAAIVSGDYSTQIAALPHTSLGLNGTLSLNNLTTIDWSTIDIILVHYGTNDWTSGVVNIGTGDITYNYDFKGMMELSIQTILAAYPKIKIVFDTLLWRDITTIPSEVTGTDFLTATNRKGNTPADFNNAIKDVCEKYYLDYFNLTFGLFNLYNKSFYLQDSAHPNDKGWQLMAEKVANLL